MLYSKRLPRRCMCGKKLRSTASLGNEPWTSTGSCEGGSNGRVLEPGRVWRTNVNHRVMNVRATAGTHFGELHPFVLGEMRENNFIGVVHVAVGRNRNAFGHLHNCIWPRNEPGFRPAT